ncbi:alpha/beta fold hydrolase [Roseateles toxinivorans]|uniref:Alpha/beta hydrolase family protein n=1 Tax=Roseateles toxinivorans TaxID=270368 RepID=A0A4R6QKG4_9BURK|nr:alpha/beta fold hydrolase [Roseateles toxinivorans]TDP63863.1 alpha/beta hydrolase family protein [Roseateles toxinivorans]
MASLLGLAAVAAALWWALFGLKPYTITDEALRARYAYSATAAGLAMQQTAEPGHAQVLRFKSFDGSEVEGRIVYPGDPATAQRPFPLLVGLHGMGRSHVRWWQGEFKQRPTVEHTHRITALALQRGYAVLALDARNHGARKNPEYPLQDLMQDLHYWGKRDPYEQMIIDTVRDYRLLLDWVQTQPQLDAGQIRVAGYSMGAQMALLIGGLDPRVMAVLAIVPPHLDNKVAAAAPRNLLAGLAGKKVWLLSADDDEHSARADNAALFEAIPGQDKQHLRFAGGHLLPAGYVDRLAPWF